MIASMWLLNGFTDPALFRDADISRLFAIFQLIFWGLWYDKGEHKKEVLF